MKTYIYKITVAVIITLIISNNLNLKKNNNRFSDLMIANIDALASNEEDQNTPCTTKMSVSYSYQKCGDREHVLARVDQNFTCNGKGTESCTNGYIYTFYDCEGKSIAENDHTYNSHCK